MSDKTELQNIIGVQADRIFDLEERIEALKTALREIVDSDFTFSTGDLRRRAKAALAPEQDK